MSTKYRQKDHKNIKSDSISQSYVKICFSNIICVVFYSDSKHKREKITYQRLESALWDYWLHLIAKNFLPHDALIGPKDTDARIKLLLPQLLKAFEQHYLKMHPQRCKVKGLKDF